MKTECISRLSVVNETKHPFVTKPVPIDLLTPQSRADD